MGNLFSIFDPQVSIFFLPLNWLSVFLGLLLIPQSFWIAKNRMVSAFGLTLSFISSEFKAILGPKATPGLIWVTVGLMIFIVSNNFLGLVPYVFTASSHLSFALTLSLPLWLGHVLMSWVKQPEPMLAHLVPLGTPYPLMPFMVIIELISSVIRPGTLAVRLAANMVAGHLLLTLIGSIAPSVGLAILMMVMVGMILLMTLECAVALIQSYVFSILMTLYIEEVSSKKIST